MVGAGVGAWVGRRVGLAVGLGVAVGVLVARGVSVMVGVKVGGGVSVGSGVLVAMGVFVGTGVWVGVSVGLGEGEGVSVVVAVAVGVKVGLGVRVGVDVTLACLWGPSWAREQAVRTKIKRIAPTATRRLFMLSPWKCPCRDWVMEHCIGTHYNRVVPFWQERERSLEGMRRNWILGWGLTVAAKYGTMSPNWGESRWSEGRSSISQRL